MDITLVAAMDQKGLVGRSGSGGIPWHLPVDAAQFRDRCRGKVVVVGRRTYGEMDGWFRRVSAIPLVFTSGIPEIEVATVRHACQVIDVAQSLGGPGISEVIVAGGAQTYAALLPIATRMVITEIAAQFEGDLYFPAFKHSAWQVISCRKHQAVPGDPDRQHAFSIVERIRQDDAGTNHIPSGRLSSEA